MFEYKFTSRSEAEQFLRKCLFHVDNIYVTPTLPKQSYPRYNGAMLPLANLWNDGRLTLVNGDVEDVSLIEGDLSVISEYHKRLKRTLRSP